MVPPDQNGERGNMALLREFIIFGIKQAAASVFAASFLLILALSRQIEFPGLARYDFLFLAALAIQLLLILSRLETAREVATLSLFHVLGVVLELFKTSPGVGSWAYPEVAHFRIATVPLYSGFMYAAIASYMMQSWRIFHLRLSGLPSFWIGAILSVLIYANFFTNHYIWDLRWPLAIAVLVSHRHTTVYFTVTKCERSMPLVLSFLLIGFFIWVAENIGTYFGGWVYPSQLRAWAIVGPHKITSWMLLVIVSFLIVAMLKRAFPPSGIGLWVRQRAVR
jgi:uncharacterized membrane protein YoaT (DUF817 family)